MPHPEAQIAHLHFWAFIAIHIRCTCHHCHHICCTPIHICCTPCPHLLHPLSAFVAPLSAFIATPPVCIHCFSCTFVAARFAFIALPHICYTPTFVAILWVLALVLISSQTACITLTGLCRWKPFLRRRSSGILSQVLNLFPPLVPIQRP